MMVSSIKLKENEEYKNLLDLFFPVGSVYLTISETSPSAYLGGTWVKIEAGFLAIAGKVSGSAYNTNFANAGAFAGSLYLGVSQIPGHTHIGPSHTHALNGSGAAASSAGAHTHSWKGFVLYRGTTQTTEKHLISGNDNVGSTTSNGAHTHSLTGYTAASGTGATGSTGNGEAFIPYSRSFHVWKRTA